MEECRYEKNDIEENEQGTEALVLSDEGMRIMAFWMVLLFRCVKDGRFDPIFLMENIIPIFDGSFNYEIIKKEDWIYEESIPAFYNPRLNKIFIRGDVYDGALAGNFMDIITITHEDMHAMQNILRKILNVIKVAEVRTELCRTDSKAMQNHELQTDRITSLIFSPQRIVEGKSEEEILKNYFVKPLFQFFGWCLKMESKSIDAALNNMKISEDKKEFEVCIV